MSFSDHYILSVDSIIDSFVNCSIFGRFWSRDNSQRWSLIFLSPLTPFRASKTSFHNSICAGMWKALKIRKLLFGDALSNWIFCARISFFVNNNLLNLIFLVPRPYRKNHPFCPHSRDYCVLIVDSKKKAIKNHFLYLSAHIWEFDESCPIKYANQIIEFNFWWKEHEGTSNRRRCPPQRKHTKVINYETLFCMKHH